MQNFFGLRLGKVINVHYSMNTVDVMMSDAATGVVYNVMVVTPFASTNTGILELPNIKTINNNYGYVTSSSDPSNPTKTNNLYPFENNKLSVSDLEDPATNYAYGIIGMFGETVGKVMPICLGFVYPFRNQILFDPDNINPSLPAYVQDAIKKMKGAYLHRTNSDVYWVVDQDGNTEWSHPNGSFIRIAESPTQEEDGDIHVDLSNGNRMSRITGDTSNLSWNTSLKNGADGNPNNARKLYAHVEIVTEKGIVQIDINKSTGNITIKTPVDTSNASQSNNQLNIICGGDVTLESVAGDVSIQSAKKDINIESYNNIMVKTDNAQANSIILAPNSSRQDNLVLFKKLAEKFNKHTHYVKSAPGKSLAPDQKLDASTDATIVTTAG